MLVGGTVFSSTVELRKYRSGKKDEAKAIIALADRENRDMSPAEEKQFKQLVADVEDCEKRLDALEGGGSDDVDDTTITDPSEIPGRSRSRQFKMQIGAGPQGYYDKPRQGGFNLGNAIRSVLTSGRVDGYEGEVSQKLARTHGKSLRQNSFMVPWHRNGEQRTLNTTTGAGSVFTETRADDFIEILRRKTIAHEMGVTFYDGLFGVVRFPRQSGSATTAWIGEGSAVTPSNQTIDYVPLTPRTLACQSIWSRKFLLESGIDVNKFVTDDLTMTMARELDRVVFAGEGTGAIPLGLLTDSGLVTIPVATNGGPLTYALMNQAEETLLEANGIVNADKVAYLTSPMGQRYLKTTARLGSTFPSFIADETNKILGTYPLVASNVMPVNLTKGSGTGLTCGVLGDWSQIICGNWAHSFTIIVDDYTRAGYGETVVTALWDMDTARRHLGSFVAFLDVASN